MAMTGCPLPHNFSHTLRALFVFCIIIKVPVKHTSMLSRSLSIRPRQLGIRHNDHNIHDEITQVISAQRAALQGRLYLNYTPSLTLISSFLSGLLPCSKSR